MHKNYIYLILLLFSSNCSLPNTVFIGPVLTGVKTGNVYQTSLSYTSNRFIRQFDPQKIIYQIKPQREYVNKNLTLRNMPFIEVNPKVALVYKVDNIVISNVNEPEPFP